MKNVSREYLLGWFDGYFFARSFSKIPSHIKDLSREQLLELRGLIMRLKNGLS